MSAGSSRRNPLFIIIASFRRTDVSGRDGVCGCCCSVVSEPWWSCASPTAADAAENTGPAAAHDDANTESHTTHPLILSPTPLAPDRITASTCI